MKLPIAQRLHFDLPHEIEAKILNRVIEEGIERARADVENAFPEGLPMMEKPGDPEERLKRYLFLTTAESDYMLLADEDYIEKFKKREAPPPLSEFWRQLSMFPDEFKAMASDFRSISKKKFG